MINATIDNKEIEKLLKKVKSWQKRTKKLVIQEMDKTGINIQAGAKERVPYDTGLLRSRIRTHRFNDGLSQVIGAATNYAAYVEFGTGAFVEIPEGLEGYASQFKGKGKRSVNIRPQAFLYPAFEEERPKLLDRLEKVLNRNK